MLWRPLAPGSQPRKWSNERFSIMSTTTCSTPFEPCGESAGAALAAVWDRNSVPVMAAPVEAPMSWRKVRRVSMKASMRLAANAHKDHEIRILAVFTRPSLPGFQLVLTRCPGPLGLPRGRSPHNGGPPPARAQETGDDGRSNRYPVAASPGCGVRRFRYAGISALAPKVAPRLRDGRRTGPAG